MSDLPNMSCLNFYQYPADIGSLTPSHKWLESNLSNRPLENRPHCEPCPFSNVHCSNAPNFRLTKILAEREGFEPPVEFPPHLLSRQTPSAGLGHLSDFVGGPVRQRRTKVLRCPPNPAPLAAQPRTGFIFSFHSLGRDKSRPS